MGYQYSINSKYNVLVTVVLTGAMLAAMSSLVSCAARSSLSSCAFLRWTSASCSSSAEITPWVPDTWLHRGQDWSRYYIGDVLRHHLDLRLFSSVSILLSFSSMTFLMASLNIT